MPQVPREAPGLHSARIRSEDAFAAGKSDFAELVGFHQALEVEIIWRDLGPGYPLVRAEPIWGTPSSSLSALMSIIRRSAGGKE